VGNHESYADWGRRRGHSKPSKVAKPERLTPFALLSDWALAGQSPDTFWSQTPASFDAVMRGAIRARRMQGDADLALAYSVAALSAAAQAGKLKSLSHYQRRGDRGNLAQTPQEMLSVFRQFKARGAPINIQRVRREPS
jgi:hypothetical protein